MTGPLVIPRRYHRHVTMRFLEKPPPLPPHRHAAARKPPQPGLPDYRHTATITHPPTGFESDIPQPTAWATDGRLIGPIGRTGLPDLPGPDLLTPGRPGRGQSSQ